MAKDVIYVPIDRELYHDIIIFSEGRLDPAYLAEEQIRDFVERTIEDADWWGDRLDEVAEKYAPHVLKKWRAEDESAAADRSDARKPLVWKEISVPANSEVRMAYGGEQHYAKVKGGYIVDDNKQYSPSEWASKVAGDTSRNAWRDLWFKEPHSTAWIPAQLLREAASQDANERAQRAAKPQGEQSVVNSVTEQKGS